MDINLTDLDTAQPAQPAPLNEATAAALELAAAAGASQEAARTAAEVAREANVRLDFLAQEVQAMGSRLTSLETRLTQAENLSVATAEVVSEIATEAETQAEAGAVENDGPPMPETMPEPENKPSRGRNLLRKFLMG